MPRDAEPGREALVYDPSRVSWAVAEAVSTLAGVSTVYVIEAGKARQQQVTLGARQDKLVEVTTGLKGDETLAETNLSQLATGVAVRTGSAGEENASGASGGAEGRGDRGGRRGTRQ